MWHNNSLACRFLHLTCNNSSLIKQIIPFLTPKRKILPFLATPKEYNIKKITEPFLLPCAKFRMQMICALAKRNDQS